MTYLASRLQVIVPKILTGKTQVHLYYKASCFIIRLIYIEEEDDSEG